MQRVYSQILSIVKGVSCSREIFHYFHSLYIIRIGFPIATMPPKKGTSKSKIKTIHKNVISADEVTGCKHNNVNTEEAEQETEVAPSTSKKISNKRGTQMKIEEEDKKEQPVRKRGRQNVVDEEKSKVVATKSAAKKTRKMAEETVVEIEKLTKEKVPATSVVDNKNKSATDWKAITIDCKKKNDEGGLSNTKITSWNVDGLRAWLKKGGLQILEYDSPDILCLQETKCSNDKLPEEITEVPGYHKFWCASLKNGYAGVGLLTIKEPLTVTYGIKNEEQDKDGRCLTAEYEKFFLVNVYVPNAGRKLVTLDKRLQWNELFKDYIKQLDKEKPVIICGDFNVAHNEIDLTNPKSNKKSAGFTIEEREGMTDFLQEGFIDTFRHLYPNRKDVYTFWTYMSNARNRNVGWRLDYFLISKLLQKKICDSVVLDKVYGSDHCPISLFIRV